MVVGSWNTQRVNRMMALCLQVGIKLIGDSASAFGPPFRLQALHSDFMVVDREKSPETLVRYDGIAALTIIP